MCTVYRSKSPEFTAHRFEFGSMTGQNEALSRHVLTIEEVKSIRKSRNTIIIRRPAATAYSGLYHPYSNFLEAPI
jgi:hypothetical protein